MPDPASQFQPDGVHGHSQVLDHGAYAWHVDEWRGRPWHEAVIYELHVGLFGSYAEVERFLPRLVELGVTAVELMPLGEFPGRRNWGYDGVLPFAPASAYGTPEQLKHLIDSAHGMGLMVFVDVIYNHFGPDGNYLAQYAAAFFRDDRQTPWGQAIDFRRGEVREFFYENALMWLLDYRVDGLRFDAVHAIPDSAFLVEMARRLRGAAGPERHVHLVLRTTTTAPACCARATTHSGTTMATMRCTSCSPARTTATTRTTPSRCAAWRAAWPKASSTRAKPTATAGRAANRVPTWRRTPSCCFCKTTTRSATAPSASVSASSPNPRRCAWR